MKIIAESAFNHSGSLEYLLKLADAAKASEADIFTAQIMNVDAFCVEDYERYPIYKDTEFSDDEWRQVFDHCKSIDIEVIPCVLDEASFDLCYNYGFRFLKIHATDITNKPFLEFIASKGNCKILLETQCATLFEINYAINILGKENIEALFTGYSNYPTEVEELNLNSLDAIRNEFNCEIGFADHSTDTIEVPLMALAKNCAYLEKHITLSRNDRNFDWQVSLYPQQFKAMVNTLKYYQIALGNGVKHPMKNEKTFRNVLYKKKIEHSKTLKRADGGQYQIEHEIDNFDKKNVIVALIARLKSQRLERKVLKKFHTDAIIVDLYHRLKKSILSSEVILATSNLTEDYPLIELANEHNLKSFQGHAVSVIDRMLTLAFDNKAGAIFRVTGDNPFTDPVLMDEMVQLYLDHDLDYVKVNNVPFGVSAELFSTKYLWQLYLKMENPLHSEYLTWYVLNDEEAKKGCIDLTVNGAELDLINLSIDYQEDYDRCKQLLKTINKDDFNAIQLKDVLSVVGQVEKMDGEKSIKLPQGESIKLRAYLDAFKNLKYHIRKEIKV